MKQKALKVLSATTCSVYLTHYFVLVLFDNILIKLSWLCSYILFVCIAWVVGYFGYKFIERPVGDFLIKNIKK